MSCEEELTTRSTPQRQPPYCSRVIRPSLIPDRLLIDSLSNCFAVIHQCQVGPSPLPPDLSHSKQSTGQDWVGGKLNNCGLECWRLSQRAVFAGIISAQEAATPPSQQPSISLEDMLMRLTQTFRFAARLADKAIPDAEVTVGVRLADIGNRPLLIEGGFGRLQFSSSENELSHSWPCSQEALLKPDQLAVDAAFWFSERFNWEHVTKESLTNVQKRFLRQM